MKERVYVQASMKRTYIKSYPEHRAEFHRRDWSIDVCSNRAECLKKEATTESNISQCNQSTPSRWATQPAQRSCWWARRAALLTTELGWRRPMMTICHRVMEKASLLTPCQRHTERLERSSQVDSLGWRDECDNYHSLESKRRFQARVFINTGYLVWQCYVAQYIWNWGTCHW